MGAGPANWSGSPWRDWRGRPPFCCGRARGETSAAHLSSPRGVVLGNKAQGASGSSVACSHEAGGE
jgi:hypothetical protein